MIKQPTASFSFPQFTRLLMQQKKITGMYALLMIVISFSACFLLAGIQGASADGWAPAVQLFFFVALGIINGWIFYKRNLVTAFSLPGASLAFAAVLFALMTLVLLLYYYISATNGWEMAFASSAAFLLPSLVYQGWLAYQQIPAGEYPVWRLPELDTAPVNPAYAGTGNMLIQLKLKRSTNHVSENTYPVTVPGKLKLGRVFEKFIADQQQQGSRGWIEIKNGKQQPFDWQFYEYKWRGVYRSHLDPSRSLVENNIKSNSVIVVKRISSVV